MTDQNLIGRFSAMLWMVGILRIGVTVGTSPRSRHVQQLLEHSAPMVVRPRRGYRSSPVPIRIGSSRNDERRPPGQLDRESVVPGRGNLIPVSLDALRSPEQA